MGSYLSEPVTEKETSFEENEFLSVASSSMQGWRVRQEDAHNAILDFDKSASFFAVYDGHGGHEVAAYCAQKLPDFIKNNEEYKKGNIEKSLIDSFVGFDQTIVDRAVVAELKKIAGHSADEDEDEVDQRAEVDHLFKEAIMPIEQVMAKYAESNDPKDESRETTDAAAAGSSSKPPVSSSGGKAADEADGQGPSASIRHPAVAELSKRIGKSISPFLRAKPSSFADKSKKSSVLDFEDGDHSSSSPEKKLDEKTANHSNDTPDEEGHKVSDGHKEKDGDEKPAKLNGQKKEDQTEEKEEVEEGKLSNGEVLVSVKGKGKGKGQSSMAKLVDPKDESQNEADKAVIVRDNKPKKARKSAQELYMNMLTDSLDESDVDTTSDDEDDDDHQGDKTYQGQDSGSEDDDDEDEEDEGDNESKDDDEDEEESDTEDDSEDEDESNEENFIGGNFNEEPGNDSGCTAVVALLFGKELYVANAGDSRCVVCRDGKAVDMSFDHKPEDDIEMARITKAGGKVTPDGRVNGGLNLSRAIGDHAYKTNDQLPLKDQMISPLPDVRTLTIDPRTDSFIFLACDGIWNSMSSQEVCDFIKERLRHSDSSSTATADKTRLKSICNELFDHCLAPDTMGDGTGCDNMTAVLVLIKPSFGQQHDQSESSSAKRPAENGSPDSEQRPKKVKMDEK